MEALLFDLDGVLYQGDRIIDGAVETVRWCEQRNIPYRFVTKTTETVMIGDDIHSDVAGAQAAGLTGILVRTGKFRTADLDGALRPDAVLGSVADLPRWWDKHHC